jgi:hypothetical protein
MGRSHRGNFVRAGEMEPHDESRLLDAEGEWAREWERTAPVTHPANDQADGCAQTAAGSLAELEVVIAISLRPKQELRIKFLA